MKILKIVGIVAGLHAIALLIIFTNPGCSSTSKAAGDTGDASGKPAPSDAAASAPSTGTETGATTAPAPSPVIAVPDSTGPVTSSPESSVGIRYSPTRPGTPTASALEAQPVSGVTPATTYAVVKGDSLSLIAKRNHIKVSDLAAANNLHSSSVLKIGEKLVIPSKAVPADAGPDAGSASGSSASGISAAGTGGAAAMNGSAGNTGTAASAASGGEATPTEVVKHTVKPGETLGAIAKKYGVRMGDLAAANSISDPKRIQPGQVLVIPAKSAGSKTSRSAKPASTKTQAQAASSQSATSGIPAISSSPITSSPISSAPPENKTVIAVPAGDQDLDAGLKPAAAGDVPVVKVEDSSSKNP